MSRKSSIHFKPANIVHSEKHNLREKIPSYVLKDSYLKNETYVLHTLQEELNSIEVNAKKIGKRKLQKNANPIKEAVVVIDHWHTMNDLKNLSKALNDKYKIELVQAYLHRDEGKNRNDINYHAHLLFSFWDKKKGKSIRLNKLDMKQIQTLTAEILGMERGVENSSAKRLEHKAYREKMERLFFDLEQSTELEETRDFLIKKIEEINYKLRNKGITR